MIRYDYKCNHCLWVWETVCTIDDNSSEQCPKCDSCRTKKVISPISFIKNHIFLQGSDSKVKIIPRSE